MNNKESKLKLLIVGLDGATFRIIEQLLSQGKLPNLKKLIKEGSWGNLYSTIPPVSACAWSSFMTGKNPGKHGIFHWRTYNPLKYTSQNKELVNNKNIKGMTFWDILSEKGYKIGVISVPVTFPVWKINGVMIAGYPCPDKELNYTYPEEYANKLTESYNYNADYYIRTPDIEVAKNGIDMLEKRTSLALNMVRNDNLDVCVLVLGEIDRAQHDFWKYMDPSFRAYHDSQDEILQQAIINHYITSDKQLGRLLELCNDDTTVVVMSDHGGGPHPQKYFHTSSWLKEKKYLKVKSNVKRKLNLIKPIINKIRQSFPLEEKLKRILPEKIVDGIRSIEMELSAIDWKRTKAYRFPMYHPAEGIEINLRGRQPAGIVAPGREYQELKNLLKKELFNAKDCVTGEKLIEHVYFKEEIYKGEFINIAPDIIFLTTENYKTNAHIAPSEYTQKVNLDSLIKYNGVHTMKGIFIAYGKNIRKNKKIENAEIIDIFPTALYALGVPIPNDVDGKILFDIFEEFFKKINRPRYSDKIIKRNLEKDTTSHEEEKRMKEKLRGLGYID